MEQNNNAKKVSKGLGIFSLALGLGEVVLTRTLARASGFNQEYTPLLRAFGYRELTSGVGLLMGRRRNAWMWSRVIGDVLDGAFMAYAYAKADTQEKRKRLAISAAIVAPVIVMDVINSFRESSRAAYRERRLRAG